MGQSVSGEDHQFDRPGKYLLRVQGLLDESWSEKLGGLSITVNDRDSHSPVTTLVGQLRDQAELSGVLNTLYELHLTLLSVEYLGSE